MLQCNLAAELLPGLSSEQEGHVLCYSVTWQQSYCLLFLVSRRGMCCVTV